MNNILKIGLMASALLWIGVPPVMPADRLYCEPINIQPGETKTLCFILDNAVAYSGLQADIALPEGLEFKMEDDEIDFRLTDRMAGLILGSNKVANGNYRVLSMSFSHALIQGNAGKVFTVDVTASPNFTGGTLTLNEIYMSDENDKNIGLSDFSCAILPSSQDYFRLEDFSLELGDKTSVNVELDNVHSFSGFTTDIVLPEGLTILPASVSLTLRSGNGHTVSTTTLSDGTLRVVCQSSDNQAFSGTSGALLSLDVTASDEIEPGEVKIRLENQVFSDTSQVAYRLDDTETTVTLEKSPLIGDADDSGEIDINDAVTVINYIIGNDPGKWNMKTADVDFNNEIDINDAVGIINMIISGN